MIDDNLMDLNQCLSNDRINDLTTVVNLPSILLTTKAPKSIEIISDVSLLYTRLDQFNAVFDGI